MPEASEERALLAARSSGSVRNAVLLTQFGGLEIEQALSGVLGQPKLNMTDVFRLADAASGRDRQIQFDLFNRLALDRIADRARLAGEEGDTFTAASLAELHEDMRTQLIETETYNLDRRQHIIGTISTLHTKLGGMPQAL